MRQAEYPASKPNPESRTAAPAPELSKSIAPTAEESARRWLEYRQTHGPGPTADEAARNWLALREREKLAGPSEAKTPRSRDQDLKRSSPDDEDDDRKRRRERGLDFEL